MNSEYVYSEIEFIEWSFKKSSIEVKIFYECDVKYIQRVMETYVDTSVFIQMFIETIMILLSFLVGGTIIFGCFVYILLKFKVKDIEEKNVVKEDELTITELHQCTRIHVL